MNAAGAGGTGAVGERKREANRRITEESEKENRALIGPRVGWSCDELTRMTSDSSL